MFVARKSASVPSAALRESAAAWVRFREFALGPRRSLSATEVEVVHEIEQPARDER